MTTNDVCMSCGKQGGTTPHPTQPERSEGLRSCPDYRGCLDRQKGKRDLVSANVEGAALAAMDPRARSRAMRKIRARRK